MNIQAIARRTGVAPATLRKWEQRYGVLQPARTEGAHRRYSERDVIRIEWLKERLAEGYRIGEAAELLGSEQLMPASDTLGLAEELVAAAAEASSSRVSRVLDQAFALHPPDEVIADVVEPGLDRVGELWREGGITVAEEHHVTELVRAKLRGLLDSAFAGPKGIAVLCCVPGERHDCGLLSFGVLLHAKGWRIVYLGADTPLEEAAYLADTFGARILAVAATMPEAAAAAAEKLARLERSYPELAIVRGGAGFGDEPATTIVDRLRARAAAG